MDRFIVTLGEETDSVDVLKTNKSIYIAIAKLAMGILGSTTLLNGFACTPNSVPNMNVQIAAGEIYELAQVDSTPYGDLPIDSHQIFKQGINLDPLPTNPFTFTAPTTPGQSVNYLIEYSLQEADTVPENRQFYNASPQVVNTIRQDSVFVKALAGTPASTGSQVTPTPEAGFVGGQVVTIAYGQTTITSGDISIYPNAPFITEKLKDKISKATADTLYTAKKQAAFRAYHNVSQTINNTDVLVMPLNLTSFNEGTFYNTTTYKYQPTIAAYYRVTGSFGNETGSGGAIEIEIWKNGAPCSTTVMPGIVRGAHNVSDTIFLNGTTDYIQLVVTNLTGGTITSTTDSNRTFFTAVPVE